MFTRYTTTSKWAYLKVRTVLEYEAAVRGMTVNRVALELALEAADPRNRYPEPLQQRIAELHRQIEAEAAAKALGTDAQQGD